MSKLNSLMNLKALVDREYVKAVMKDIDEMDLTRMRRIIFWLKP